MICTHECHEGEGYTELIGGVSEGKQHTSQYAAFVIIHLHFHSSLPRALVGQDATSSMGG